MDRLQSFDDITRFSTDFRNPRDIIINPRDISLFSIASRVSFLYDFSSFLFPKDSACPRDSPCHLLKVVSP